ncbi:unnamed protein product, partial [Gadus morhua 'NCC']
MLRASLVRPRQMRPLGAAESQHVTSLGRRSLFIQPSMSHILSISASTGCVERIFSRMANKWSDCRNRCSTELMRKGAKGRIGKVPLNANGRHLCTRPIRPSPLRRLREGAKGRIGKVPLNANGRHLCTRPIRP